MKSVAWVTCEGFDGGYEPVVVCGEAPALPIRPLAKNGSGPFRVGSENVLVSKEISSDKSTVKYSVRTTSGEIYAGNPANIVGKNFEQACSSLRRKDASFIVPFINGKEPLMGELEAVQIDFSSEEIDESKVLVIGYDFGGKFRDLKLRCNSGGEGMNILEEEEILQLIDKGVAKLDGAKFQVKLILEKPQADLPKISLWTIRIECEEGSTIHIGKDKRHVSNDYFRRLGCHKAVDVDLVYSSNRYEHDEERSNKIEVLSLTKNSIRPVVEN